MKKTLIAIGQDVKLLDDTSRVFQRHEMYASALDAFHVVVASPIKKEIHKSPLHIYGVGGRHKLSIATRVFWRAYRLARRESAVITSQNPFELGLIAYVVARLTRSPLNLQVHGDFYSSPAWRDERLYHRLLAPMGLFLLRRATSVRVVSKRIADSIVDKGVARDRIAVTPIDMSFEKFLAATPTPLWPTVEGQVTLLAVGRFAPEKNFSLLIRAFYHVHRECSLARLVIVGEGKEKERLATLITKLWPSTPPVLLLPWQTDISAVMRAADIGVVSSNYEGYGMVIGEFMATGRPLVTTDVGCVKELFLSNTHGLSVPVGDEAALANALKTLVKDQSLRTTYGAAARATIVGLTSNQMSTETYLKSIGI
jgi:glycosyltransferase involved in cell wall biosynthesis